MPQLQLQRHRTPGHKNVLHSNVFLRVSQFNVICSFCTVNLTEKHMHCNDDLNLSLTA